MKCPKCGFENREGVKFCEECGTEMKIQCPDCGAKISPERKFCGECGTKLAAGEKPPVDYSQPQSYTPSFLSERILTTRSAIEGERKLVTVFFADVAGFTALSEDLDPEEVHQIMDGAFKILMDEIHRFEGTINQFTGDGVMAIFGAPLALEDHTRRACHAALSVQHALEEYGEKIKKEYSMEFKMRIGLNSGHVIVGSIGDDLRMDYTAVGDITNLAARMENLATPGSVLVSANSHRLAADFFEFKSKGKLEIKGKTEKQEIFELIKAGEVETRIGASVAKGLTRFVGRKEPLAVLNAAYEKVQSGSGQVIGIVGEAGVGKSRLLLEFIGQLPQEEFSILQGQCLHFGGSMAYLPFLDIIKSYYGIKEGDREVQVKNKVNDKTLSLDDKLQTIISPFCELLSIKTKDEEYSQLDPKIKKEKTFEALRDLFIRESQNRPLVLIIEDLHWMDNTSQEYIDYLIGWLTNTQILLLLLYRPEYTHSWGSKSFYTKIGLDQLNPASSMELIKAMLEEGEAAPELRELILSRSAGNPLFMEEFTSSLLENGTIEKQDQVYVLLGNIKDIQVPDTVQGIIAARMDRLEENLKRTMQVASVIGRDFAFKVLHTITDIADELKPCLLNLQGLEFIYEKQLFPELEYIFKHALIQEVAYDSLLVTRRKEIHQRIGQAIEELYPDRLQEFYEMLAYHYSKAKNLEKAYQYLKLSGQKAEASFNHQEALGLLKQGIHFLDRMPKNHKIKTEQIEIRLLMIKPMTDLAYPDDALEILEQGLILAVSLSNVKARIRFLANLAVFHFFKSNPQLSVKYSEDALKIARQTGDVDALVVSTFVLCIVYCLQGKLETMFELAPEIFDVVEKSNRMFDDFGITANPYFYLKAYYSYSLFVTGKIEEAKEHFERLQLLIPEIELLTTRGLVESFYGLLLLETGDFPEAVRIIQIAIDCAEKGQIPPNMVFALSFMGHALHHRGDLDSAKVFLGRAVKLREKIGNAPFSYYTYFSRFLVHLAENELGKAEQSAYKVEEVATQNGEIGGIGLSKLLLGKIKALKEPTKLKVAEKTILDGVKILKNQNQKVYYPLGYFYLGELFGDAGKNEEAVRYLKMAEGLYQEMGFVYWLGRTREVLDRF
ncbi:MAG: AAA family ATPase [Deltaproteobacteria bacterium]|nr:AAA family ATPase [Deltaproteobacteria bacterium]